MVEGFFFKSDFIITYFKTCQKVFWSQSKVLTIKAHQSQDTKGLCTLKVQRVREKLTVAGHPCLADDRKPAGGVPIDFCQICSVTLKSGQKVIFKKHLCLANREPGTACLLWMGQYGQQSRVETCRGEIQQIQNLRLAVCNSWVSEPGPQRLQGSSSGGICWEVNWISGSETNPSSIEQIFSLCWNRE